MQVHSEKTRGLFSRKQTARRDEENLSLRMIVLAIGIWVAFSLAWVGAPLWAWVGGSALIGLGHAFSWRSRNSKSVIRSAVVGVAILGTLVLVPHAISLALGGNWLPVASFLLIFQGITSFEMRSRAGLYASLGISGAIIFFVSQLALDVMFGVFMTGFTTLLLAFLAMSFLVDQARDAEVKWFRGRFSFAWFWTAIFIMSLAMSVLIFMLMPKNFSDPVTDAQGAVLPMRASSALQSSQTLPDLASVTSALPLTTSEESRENPNIEELTQTENQQKASEASGNSDAADGSQDDSQSEQGVGEDTVTDVGDATASQGESPLLFLGESGGAQAQGSNISAGNSLVMQVRSPVLTYWRAEIFDSFDGQNWHTDPHAWVVQSRSAARTVYGAPQPSGIEERPLYPQTFFLKEGATQGLFLSGYDPVVAAIPSSSKGLGDGSVYRVISALPDLSKDALEAVDPTTRLEYRYHQIPSSLDGIHEVASGITDGAFTDLERIRRIVTFIDGNYKFDDSAVDQLARTLDPLEFLSGQSTSGTSMDFATATVLLARASGIPARLVTGYLPGQFDPLSGTYMVRESDQHAWAEIFLGGTGWVPFDSAPRQATAGFGEGGSYQAPGISALFSSGYGDDIYESLKSSPQWITDFLARVLGEGVAALIVPMLGFTLLTLSVMLIRKFAPMIRRRERKLRYTRLKGDGRAEMLKVYRSAESMLGRVGVASRAPWQTLSEHTEQAETSLGDANAHLAWLRNAARIAAYDPAPYDPNLLVEAKDHLSRLKAALKSQRRPRQQPQF